MVTLGGFDTHANQPDRHENLMKTLTNAINVFYNDLDNHGIADKVLGRRVAENGSDGTDHGSAAPLMLFGPALNGSSFIGSHPDLNVLDSRGNMKSTVDFKSVYATILKDWLCVDDNYVNQAIIGSEFDFLGLGLGCNGIQNLELTNDSILTMHAAVIDGDEVNLYLNLNEPVRLEVFIFDILGRKVGSVYNDQFSTGNHRFPLLPDMYSRLPRGQYFYKIRVNGDRIFSRSFIVK